MTEQLNNNLDCGLTLEHLPFLSFFFILVRVACRNLSSLTKDQTCKPVPPVVGTQNS